MRIEKIVIETPFDDDADYSWLEQTPAQLGSLVAAVENRRRLDSLKEGNWHFVGCRLRADIQLENKDIGLDNTRIGATFSIYSPGIWGIESDSGESFFREIADDEKEMLASDLCELGFSSSDIETAFSELEFAE